MSDATSSSSTLISFAMAKTFVPKTVLETMMKLNGSNYLLCADAFHIFIGAQNKLTHLLQLRLLQLIPLMQLGFLVTYVMTWLLNALKEKISGSVIFLTTAKEMWDP